MPEADGDQLQRHDDDHAGAAPLRGALHNDLDRDVLAAMAQDTLPGSLVYPARDGAEALMMVGRREPDIVITDILMPLIDGYQLIQHVQNSSLIRQPVIFAISGLPQSELAARGKLPTTVPVLYRPFEMERLVELLHAAEANIRARRKI